MAKKSKSSAVTDPYPRGNYDVAPMVSDPIIPAAAGKTAMDGYADAPSSSSSAAYTPENIAVPDPYTI